MTQTDFSCKVEFLTDDFDSLMNKWNLDQTTNNQNSPSLYFHIFQDYISERNQAKTLRINSIFQQAKDGFELICRQRRAYLFDQMDRMIPVLNVEIPPIQAVQNVQDVRTVIGFLLNVAAFIS